MNKTKRVVALLFEGSDMMDAAGPLSVFSSASLHTPISADGAVPYCVSLISIDGGPVCTEQGLTVLTEKAGELEPGEVDTLIVVGGSIECMGDGRIVDWLRRNHAAARRLGSVCLGSFLLARAGLLDGLRATTHWCVGDLMQRQFPTVEVCDDAIFIPGRHVWTSAGVTAGIDMALAMVEEDFGRELALKVARYQVVFLKRPGGQSQYSTMLRKQSAEGPLAGLLEWIADNPREDLRAESLAEKANMSLRNFFRAFVEATGSTPADWVEQTRLDIAKRLLEQTDDAVDQVAYQSGFGSYERMRKAFARRFGITPGEHRERFSRALHGDEDFTAALLATRRALLEPMVTRH